MTGFLGWRFKAVPELLPTAFDVNNDKAADDLS